MSAGKVRRYFSRLLPNTALWRLVLATAVLSLLTAAGAVVVSKIIGRDLVYSISEDNAYTVLRSAVDLIGRTSVQLAEDRNKVLEASKQSLRESLDFASGFIETYATGSLLDAQAKERGFRRLEALAVSMTPAIAVEDATGAIRIVGNGVFEELEKAHVLRDLDASARGRPAEDSFSLYVPDGRQNAVLVAARYEPLWNLTFFAARDYGQATQALQEKQRMTLNELRARINEIVVAKSVYVYVFAEDCRMVAHPTMYEGNFAELHLQGSNRFMCDVLRETAEQPWGENSYNYKWDRPDDAGNYIYDKITWSTVEPTTGWVVGVTVYKSELEAPLPRFMARIFFPALGSILLLGLALVFILRSQLRPINALTRVCQRVSHGDLDVAVNENASGEIGQLCWYFNAMIKRIKGLRQRDERRRKELEDLNLNLERKVLLRTKALERKAHKLQEVNVRLEELDELKTSFVSSVSHELRTPLTSILGFAKMIKRDFNKLEEICAMEDHAGPKFPKRIQTNLGIIVTEGERLARLINDFLDLAKIEAGRLDWSDSLIDFHELVMDCLDVLQGHIRLKEGVNIRYEITPDMPPLYVDRDRLTQVIINLMNNALKFTDAGEVLLFACHDGDALQCRIKDTGQGIQVSELCKVFDKFHQVSEKEISQKKTPGTGLGLAICRNIIEHYNGLIWAESAPDKGCEVVFEIPLRRDLEDVEKLTSGSDDAGGIPRRKEEVPLILVVDDDQHIQTLLQNLFEDAGYRVATAPDGETALRWLQTGAPDLITMDLMLPGMPGSQAIQRLRSDPRFKDIPVILVSALADRDADDHTDSNAVIPKPIDEKMLLTTVQTLLLGDEKPLPDLDFLEQHPQWRAGIPYVCDGQGNCYFCSLSEIGARMETGFTGIVCVPRQIEDTPEVQALARAGGVQVVVL